jgi:hypothetical protein
MSNTQIQSRRHLPHPNIKLPRKVVLTSLLKDQFSYSSSRPLPFHFLFFIPSTIRNTIIAIFTVRNWPRHKFCAILNYTWLCCSCFPLFVMFSAFFILNSSKSYVPIFSRIILNLISGIINPTPNVANDNAGLQNIFHAIPDAECSARSPIVPTSPYSDDVNLPPTAVSGTYTHHSLFISCS